ncbi:DUF2934 domain-containing protein [Azospirillum argentinense]|uniref:DUF2934 domain-containing protein n=1 Tax=Azospirillum argentinense TaxID=2970906 RepID=UPI002000447B|nr:DUF2934 domain-containing protein [Azospirillum argentinense]
MQGDREDRIRHRAYEIWERAGRPEGRGKSIGRRHAPRSKPRTGRPPRRNRSPWSRPSRTPPRAS